MVKTHRGGKANKWENRLPRFATRSIRSCEGKVHVVGDAKASPPVAKVQGVAVAADDQQIDMAVVVEVASGNPAA